MKTLLDAQKLCVSPMLGGLERFVDKTTSGRAPLKVHHTSLGSCCWSVPVRGISSSTTSSHVGCCMSQQLLLRALAPHATANITFSTPWLRNSSGLSANRKHVLLSPSASASARLGLPAKPRTATLLVKYIGQLDCGGTYSS